MVDEKKMRDQLEWYMERSKKDFPSINGFEMAIMYENYLILKQNEKIIELLEAQK